MDSYKLAVLLIRLMALTYLTVSVALLFAAVAIAAILVAIPKSPEGLGTVMGFLETYSAPGLIAGPVLLLFSRRLARVAAKFSGPSLNSE